MQTGRFVVPLALLSVASIVLAQSVAPLPKTMNGRWTFVGPAGVFTDSISVVFDGSGEPGPIRGRITVAGVTCGAKDEPLVGTWDGTELRFEMTVRPNVNTTRMNGQCGSGRTAYILVRKPGQAALEGESRRDELPGPAQIRLVP